MSTPTCYSDFVPKSRRRPQASIQTQSASAPPSVGWWKERKLLPRRVSTSRVSTPCSFTDDVPQLASPPLPQRRCHELQHQPLTMPFKQHPQKTSTFLSPLFSPVARHCCHIFVPSPEGDWHSDRIMSSARRSVNSLPFFYNLEMLLGISQLAM